uniref:Uncharacterized protein n=1 Tax=viral metagenome TaxID=1070528 RepID=A0A6C0KLP7_9ZZZZ
MDFIEIPIQIQILHKENNIQLYLIIDIIPSRNSNSITVKSGKIGKSEKSATAFCNNYECNCCDTEACLMISVVFQVHHIIVAIVLHNIFTTTFPL